MTLKSILLWWKSLKAWQVLPDGSGENVEVTRPTFEQVRENQRKLKFDFLEKLIETNEIVSKETRETFFDTIAVSLLGLEKNYQFEIGTDRMGNLALWIRKFIDFPDSKDKKQVIFISGKRLRLDNRLLWRSLMESLYEPMAEALQCALKSSAEVMGREGGTYGLKAGKQIKND